MNEPFLKDKTVDLEGVLIETTRCRLEPLQIDRIDSVGLQELYVFANEDGYVNAIQPSIDEMHDFITQSIEKRKLGQAFECFVYTKEGSVLIGVVGINALLTSEPNIWIWIRKEYRKQGYATEVYAGLLNWAKNCTRFEFFKHGVHPENTASLCLAEKFYGVVQKKHPEGGGLKYYVPVFLKA